MWPTNKFKCTFYIYTDFVRNFITCCLHLLSLWTSSGGCSFALLYRFAFRRKKVWWALQPRDWQSDSCVIIGLNFAIEECGAKMARIRVWYVTSTPDSINAQYQAIFVPFPSIVDKYKNTFFFISSYIKIFVNFGRSARQYCSIQHRCLDQHSPLTRKKIS